VDSCTCGGTHSSVSSSVSSSSSQSSSFGPTHKDCQGPNGTIISVPINQPCPTFSSSSSSLSPIHANLAILNFIGYGNVAAGTATSYEVFIKNGGPATVPNVYLDFFFPAGFSFIPSASSAECTLRNATGVRCIPGNGTMANDASATFTIGVQFPSTCSTVGYMQAVLGAPGLEDTFPSNNQQVLVSNVICSSKSSSSTAASTCGNNTKEAAEQCDDGNQTSGDGCSYPACAVETGWTCADVCSGASNQSHWFSFQSFFASIFSFFTGEPKQVASTCHSVCTRQQSSSQSSAAAQAYRFVRLSASTIPLSLTNNNLFGTTVAPMGDMDGDGTPDIAVFAPHTDYTNTAAIYILHLTPSGTVKSSDTLTYTVTDNKLARVISNGGLTAVGDLDGNGVTDIAAGTQFRSNLDVMPYYLGKVAVLLLQKNAAGSIVIKSQYAIATPLTSSLHCGSPNPTQCKANGVSLFGISLAYLGGPRRALVVGSANGAWYTELSTANSNNPAELGGGSGTPDRMLWLASGGQGPTDNIRVLLHAGDLGINYYYVDATSQMVSTSRIYSGETLNGVGPGNTLCLAQTDDLDGNGIKDLITGGTLTTSSNQGAFVASTLQRNQGGYLTLKSLNQLSSFTDASGTSHARITSVAVIGDIDADGVQDFAVGMPESEEPGGTVWLLLSKTAP